MAKRKTHKEDRKGWPLFNRLLADYIELTRFPELPERPKQGKNYEYWPEGALCANGNPYHGCIRLGSANKLMIGFSGGGVSVDAHTAARPQRVGGQGEMFYSDDVRFGDIMPRIGTFGQSKKNPFRDWNLLFVPYATGDFHCGTGDYPYTDLDGKSAVLHHHGYTNFQLLLKKIQELVPNPEQILVTGFSAGAFATSLLTDAVAAAFPKCHDITACVDSAMMHYDWQRVAREVWKAPEEIAARLTGDEIVSDSLLALHRNHPEIKILYCCSVRDAALTQMEMYLTVADDNRYLSGDLLEFLILLLKQPVFKTKFNRSFYSAAISQEFVKNGFYAPSAAYEAGEICTLLRNPHIARNEEIQLKAYGKAEQMRKHYLGHLSGVVMVDVEMLAAERLGGADYDGDMIKTISDPLLNECVKRNYEFDSLDNRYNLPLLYIPTEEPVIRDASNWHDRFITVQDTFSSRVGQICNAAFNRSVVAYDENSAALERKRCREETETLAILTGLEIDSAKSGIKPNLSQYLGRGKQSRSPFLEYKTILDEDGDNAKLALKKKRDRQIYFEITDWGGSAPTWNACPGWRSSCGTIRRG